jgi:hypothetical protein
MTKRGEELSYDTGCRLVKGEHEHMEVLVKRFIPLAIRLFAFSLRSWGMALSLWTDT